MDLARVPGADLGGSPALDSCQGSPIGMAPGGWLWSSQVPLVSILAGPASNGLSWPSRGYIVASLPLGESEAFLYQMPDVDRVGDPCLVRLLLQKCQLAIRYPDRDRCGVSAFAHACHSYVENVEKVSCLNALFVIHYGKLTFAIFLYYTIKVKGLKL